MHGKPPGNEILVILIGGWLRQRVSIEIELDQFVRLDQLLQPRLKLPARFTMQSKLAHELLVSRSALRLAGNVFENVGVRNHVEERRFSSAALAVQNKKGLSAPRDYPSATLKVTCKRPTIYDRR